MIKGYDRKKLLENELNCFIEGVRDNYNPDKIILFGSLANGEVNDDSDLDIIVIAKTNDDFWTRMKSISKFCSHKVGMDVLVYTPEEFDMLLSDRTFFKREIKEKGKIIYEQSKTS